MQTAKIHARLYIYLMFEVGAKLNKQLRQATVNFPMFYTTKIAKITFPQNKTVYYNGFFYLCTSIRSTNNVFEVLTQSI